MSDHVRNARLSVRNAKRLRRFDLDENLDLLEEWAPEEFGFWSARDRSRCHEVLTKIETEWVLALVALLEWAHEGSET